MKIVGKINGWDIYWDEQSGAVRVGGETCEDIAYSKARALEVARAYIARYPRN
jgi:hypothetical protein